MWGPTPLRPLKLQKSSPRLLQDFFYQPKVRFGKIGHEQPREVRPGMARWGRYKSFALIISNSLAASNTKANPVLAACPCRDMGHHLGEANTMAAKQPPTAPRAWTLCHAVSLIRRMMALKREWDVFLYVFMWCDPHGMDAHKNCVHPVDVGKNCDQPGNLFVLPIRSVGRYNLMIYDYMIIWYMIDIWYMIMV